jgi:hypothetical protein
VLRITRINPGERPAVLRLEGRLSGPWVPELERVVRLSSDAIMPALLDLGAMSFADPPGVTLLRRLAREGTELRGASPFVARLLRGESDECA